MISWSARCSSLASASHSNHATGTESSRPSRRATCRRARSTATDAASGYLSGRLIEELIPLPQEASAIGGDDAPDTLHLSGSVPPVVAKTDRAKPEDRPSMRRLGVDVGWLVRSLFLVREEPEAVRPEAVDGWHGDLAKRPAGRDHRRDFC